jgi:uncharacterized protein
MIGLLPIMYSTADEMEVFSLPTVTAEDDGLPDNVKDALLKALEKERPVTIGVIGVSGVGKSSLINRLFRTDFATSPTIACTKEFTTAEVELTASRGPIEGTLIPLQVVDAPGLGESRESDPGYLEAYRRHLPDCDAIIWVSTARNRAVALEQEYLAELKPFQAKMVFGVGQADLVDPLDWDERINLPSREQERNLAEICRDRAEKFSAVVGEPIEFIPFSTKRSYNLQLVFTALIEQSQRERGWLLSSLKGFRFDDWMTDEGRREMGLPSDSSATGQVDGQSRPRAKGMFSKRAKHTDGSQPRGG